ncbi:hypothetical protein KDK_03870 [Dictyobacter kobayashii]|uniref:SLC26A/SulP transporter domain-containing protein n=1 Tax=Dictyobacter kobayashii TaxID=2014872 RepID=A0A402ABW4_9CHLR|nr:hypothetical protein KDK_03870 [Dictyobacter kobayashii]
MALGGIITAGVAYAIIAIVVLIVGYRWLNYLMPGIVTGTVVMVIGLNLSVSAIKQAASTPFDAWMALVTIIAVALVSVYAPACCADCLYFSAALWGMEYTPSWDWLVSGRKLILPRSVRRRG